MVVRFSPVRRPDAAVAGAGAGFALMFTTGGGWCDAAVAAGGAAAGAGAGAFA